MPSIPHPSSSFLWTVIFGSGAYWSTQEGKLFFLFLILAYFQAANFLYDMSRFGHKDAMLVERAQMESLQAGIQKQLQC